MSSQLVNEIPFSLLLCISEDANLGNKFMIYSIVCFAPALAIVSSVEVKDDNRIQEIDKGITLVLIGLQ